MIKLTIVTKTSPIEVKIPDMEVLGKAIEGLDANKGLFLGNIWINKAELTAITIEEEAVAPAIPEVKSKKDK